MKYYDVTKFVWNPNGYWHKLRVLKKFDSRKDAVEYAKRKGNCIVGFCHPLSAGMIWAFDEFIKYANETRVWAGNKPDFKRAMCKGYLDGLRSYNANFV